ncbi:MAG: NlpC/P60 family protein [Pseudomonadota bacterium]
MSQATGLFGTESGGIRRFRLSGPAPRHDIRITPARGDLADIRLAGKVFASSYVAAIPYHCVAALTTLHRAPSDIAEAVSQLRLGDGFAVLEIAGGWCWGYCLDDGYCGYVRASSLARDTIAATHRVTARSTLIFAEADFKSPIVMRPAMGTSLVISEEQGHFSCCGQGYVPTGHIGRIDDSARTGAEAIADMAERLIGAPYVWGGRSGDGLDCSGLVQLVLALGGIAAPRDSDQQQEALGIEIDPAMALQRNDLVFFPHHVGIMVDAHLLVHANSDAMCVSVEPLDNVVARLSSRGHEQAITARKRL